MACTALTKGRGLDCNRIAGGVKNVYFSVYSDFGSTDWAYDGTHPQEIDTIDWNSKSIYKYVMPLGCLLYTSPSPRDGLLSRMPSSA